MTAENESVVTLQNLDSFLQCASERLKAEQRKIAHTAMARVRNNLPAYEGADIGYSLRHKLIDGEDIFAFCAPWHKVTSHNPLVDEMHDSIKEGLLWALTAETYSGIDGVEHSLTISERHIEIGNMYEYAERRGLPRQGVDMIFGQVLIFLRSPD